MKIAKKSLLSVGIVLALLTTACNICKKPPHHRFDRGSKEGMFDRMDKNSDGKITKSEHDTNSQEFFDSMDKNGDGVVTKEEAKNFHPKKDKRK